MFPKNLKDSYPCFMCSHPLRQDVQPDIPRKDPQRAPNKSRAFLFQTQFVLRVSAAMVPKRKGDHGRFGKNPMGNP